MFKFFKQRKAAYRQRMSELFLDGEIARIANQSFLLVPHALSSHEARVWMQGWATMDNRLQPLQRTNILDNPAVQTGSCRELWGPVRLVYARGGQASIHAT